MHQVDARRAAAPKVKTGVVQANIGIIEKWDPREFARLLATHQHESAALARAGAELMVWPESSYPYALRRAPGPFERDFPIEDGRRVRRGFETPLLFGAVTVNPPRAAAARTLPVQHGTDDERRGRGHRHLRQGVPDAVRRVHPVLRRDSVVHEAVPGGVELQPRQRARDVPARRGRPAITGWDRSSATRTSCPGSPGAPPSSDPNAFINITNDAWFGRTAEPYQHLALAVFRSVEHRLEMIRAVNTGVSAHIDAAGRVRAADRIRGLRDELPPPAPKTLLVDLAMFPGGGLYRHIGDLFGFLCLAALGALILWCRPRRRRGTGRGKKSRRASSLTKSGYRQI